MSSNLALGVHIGGVSLVAHFNARERMRENRWKKRILRMDCFRVEGKSLFSELTGTMLKELELHKN